MKLPIGIQTFEDIRKENYIYIDKTKEIYNFINSYRYIFLSRPRRFGKSLLLDTMKCLFEGKKELFKGLYIYDKWEFKEYPVIKIDWAGDFKTLESTKKTALFILEQNQKRLGIKCKETDEPNICLARLIQAAYEKYNQKVVVLIDEYDKPILDNLDDEKRAIENRDFLRSMYVQLKSNDAYIKFAFLTGITKFSRASIFSGLNNLVDISLMPRYGNICGYTHENLEREFYEYSKDFDLEKVREWYNGYYFLKDKIYNPFDILRLFDSKIFDNYWWESGNSYHVITLLKKKNYYIPSLENLTISKDLMNTFEVDSLKLEVLLYQSGYLTIKEVIEDEFETIYKLGVPNKEVQISLNKLFVEYLTKKVDNQQRRSLYNALKEANLEEFKNTLISLFASIPYNNYVKNNIASYEGYYASVVYAYLASLGLPIIAEDVTNKGRIDITIIFKEKVYIIEFKVSEKLKVESEKLNPSQPRHTQSVCWASFHNLPTQTHTMSGKLSQLNNEALEQLKQKRYYEKYLNPKSSTLNPQIYLIGIVFSEEERNIVKFDYEKIN